MYRGYIGLFCNEDDILDSRYKYLKFFEFIVFLKYILYIYGKVIEFILKFSMVIVWGLKYLIRFFVNVECIKILGE